MSEQTATAAADPLIGTVLANRYQIESKLGEGAMGAVYKARHVKVGRPFAVKVLHTKLDEPKVAQRFEREAELAGRLRHPNVVGVVDVGETPDGHRYMVMDFAAGQDLAATLGEPIPPARLIPLVRQMLEGLYHAHEAGLIHRDFKPENVIVERDDHGNEVPRIVDFGIAILREGGASSTSEGRLTTNGLVLGTPHYMAPEQAIADPIDHRIDLFALGIVVYEMACGRLPFDGSGAEVARANLVLDPPPMAQRAPGVDVDPLLEAYARKLMAKRRDDRPPTAKAARELLDLIERDRPAAAATLGVTLTPVRAPAVTIDSAPVRRLDPNSNDTFPPPIAAAATPSANVAHTTELTEPLDGPRPRALWPFAAGGALLVGGVIAAVIFSTGRHGAEPTPAPASPPPPAQVAIAEQPTPPPTPTPTPPTPTPQVAIEAPQPDPVVTKPKPKEPKHGPITKIEPTPTTKPDPVVVAKPDPVVVKPPPVETPKPKRVAITSSNVVQRWQSVGTALKQHGTDALRTRYSLIRYSDMLSPGPKQTQAIQILTELEAKLPK
jgi:serine/threonine-protein kinase